MELIFSIKVLYWSPNFVGYWVIVNGRRLFEHFALLFCYMCKAADVATVEERIDK